MNISNDNIQKALRIKRCVGEYFESTHEKSVLAKDLMNLFIKKGIFTSDYQDGLPIRDFLRLLHKNDCLNLIPQAHFDEKESNKNWYFINTNKFIKPIH